VSIWANEADTDAAASYRKNVGDHLVEGDLTQLELPLDLHPDLVIGGPPCQGFSVAGKMDPSDPRNQHAHRFLDVVHLLQPQGFVMENVKALAVNPRWETLRGVKEFEVLVCVEETQTSTALDKRLRRAGAGLARPAHRGMA
jgi:DNA (cytosine-5)-methyltransferase 1